MHSDILYKFVVCCVSKDICGTKREVGLKQAALPSSVVVWLLCLIFFFICLFVFCFSHPNDYSYGEFITILWIRIKKNTELCS